MLHHLALSLTGVIGSAAYKRIIAHYSSLENFFEEPLQQLVTKRIITPKMAEGFSPDLLERAKRTLSWCREFNISLTSLESDTYPALLREIYDPPFLLYSMGDLSILNGRAIGIVGSRDNTLYGNNAIGQLVQGLVQNNITVVSGLALGVDSAAHRATLDYSGKTAAVVANGLDTVYPAMNRQLASDILRSGGLILTESAPGSDTRPFRFLQRNRIISGVTQGTIVVEAGLKSGALSTARHAISQGRDVLAVPGPITSPQSIGPNQLILDGATPALSAEQVVQFVYGGGERQSICVSPTSAVVTQTVFEPVLKQKSSVHLNENEQSLVDRLSRESAKRMDELMELFPDSADLFEILLDLELKGVVEQLPGQLYKLV